MHTVLSSANKETPALISKNSEEEEKQLTDSRF